MKATRKVMYLNPVGTGGYDQMFADMAAKYKMPGTEAHITSLAPEDGAFTHIEMRSCEAMVTPVIDVSIAALKEAEYAAEMKANCNWKPSRKWSCEAPDKAEMEAFGAFDKGGVFGNRIVVAA